MNDHSSNLMAIDSMVRYLLGLKFSFLNGRVEMTDAKKLAQIVKDLNGQFSPIVEYIRDHQGKAQQGSASDDFNRRKTDSQVRRNTADATSASDPLISPRSIDWVLVPFNWVRYNPDDNSRGLE